MKKVLFLVFILIGACQSRPDAGSGDDEFKKLKADLFKPYNDASEAVIYSDPPTGDYEDVKEGKIRFQIDSAKIKLIDKYRTELEPTVIQYLDSGTEWVYLAAYLKYESAVPKIKQLLLGCDKFYGWEGGDYQSMDTYLRDDQYCYQMAYVSAIERITGKSLDKAITLTDEERKKLEDVAMACTVPDKLVETACSARWLLEKMKG